MSEIFDVSVEIRGQLVANISRRNGFSAICQRRDTGGKVDSVTVDVLSVIQDIGNFNSNAQIKAPVCREPGVLIPADLVNFESGGDRGPCGFVMDQQAVAHGFHQLTVPLWQNFSLNPSDEG